ncbi:MAG: DUF4105 domain-containing protein [Cyclobacteriaceae bacterium]|nr:DUF4105 domain-containing protein [Cyclobacteriaceae bacterium]
MRRFFLFVFFILGHVAGVAQSVTEATKISLLTGSPGAELYSTFGHSALRVRDESQNMDIVFNYGTFDFNTPNFYLKFARGKLDYKLSVEQFEQFMASFTYENRSVLEQELNLDVSQKQRLISLLFRNYEPKNRFYKYDFFYDNCATRIRDIMLEAYGEDFHYYFPSSWSNSDLTFRNLIDMYLRYHHWSDFGIDIALGVPTDKFARPMDYMFLPDYLSEGFGSASLQNGAGEVPLVKEQRLLLAKTDQSPQVLLISPIMLFWSLFFIVALLSGFQLQKGWRMPGFDKLFFSTIGMLGWVVFLLWFFTDHIATKNNLNILWAVPIHFPLFLFWNKFSGTFKKWYIMIFAAINVLILILWSFFPQQYHYAFIPLILVMLMRYYFLYREINANHVGGD